jgi:hypothetical protein
MFEVWSPKCEVWSPKSEVRSPKSEVWTVQNKDRSIQKGHLRRKLWSFCLRACRITHAGQHVAPLSGPSVTDLYFLVSEVWSPKSEVPSRLPYKCGSNFRTQYKSIQNLRTLQGYIFRILQHFATKHCNFTNFSMLFPGIYFFAKIKN